MGLMARENDPSTESRDNVRPQLGPTVPLSTPLYTAAVYTVPDLDALDQIADNKEPGFIYARDGHPNAYELAARMAAIEGCLWGQMCGSGMSALTAAILGLVQSGDRVVAGNRLYGRTVQLLGTELPKLGVNTTFVDANDSDEVSRALGAGARLLLVETLSNPLLRLTEVERLAHLAHQHETYMVVDNTFATPVLFKPIGAGADLVIESLTKMIGGHSDVTLGFVGGQDRKLQKAINQCATIWGLSSSPFDCWLALRGLETLPLRVKAASANALVLADWLVEQPGVKRVVYPGMDDHPDHELAKRTMNGAYGNMLAFEMAGGREGVNRFMREAPGIPFSPSLGHSSTTCSHPWTTSHRYVSSADKKRQGITDGLVRLSVGCEDIETIKAELSRGLAE
jgi:cystathionine gamma-synthase